PKGMTKGAGGVLDQRQMLALADLSDFRDVGAGVARKIDKAHGADLRSDSGGELSRRKTTGRTLDIHQTRTQPKARKRVDGGDDSIGWDEDFIPGLEPHGGRGRHQRGCATSRQQAMRRARITGDRGRKGRGGRSGSHPSTQNLVPDGVRIRRSKPRLAEM